MNKIKLFLMSKTNYRVYLLSKFQQTSHDFILKFFLGDWLDEVLLHHFHPVSGGADWELGDLRYPSLLSKTPGTELTNQLSSSW